VYGAGLASKAGILVGVCGAARMLLDLCEPLVVTLPWFSVCSAVMSAVGYIFLVDW
jgi:hypothetical protein